MSTATVYNIQRMSTKDGPGLRTTVFLKGCPLRCSWCSNPESQSFSPQLMLFSNLCTACSLCTTACPNGAMVQEGNTFNRDVNLCKNCGACVPTCPSRARVMSGESMTVEQIMEIVRKDALFYANSEGGVTIGGGEPTAAGDFLVELLMACRDEGFHTCVDTCGFCAPEQFQKIVPLTELFLFDSKHMDPTQHKSLTGQDNVHILANLRTALASKVQTRIRMPLIPGKNDTEDNIRALAELLHEYNVHEVDVMPYHAFGRSKYTALLKPYPTHESYCPEELKIVLDRFAQFGLTPLIA